MKIINQMKSKLFWVFISVITAFVFGILFILFEKEWLLYPIYVSFGYCAVLGVIVIIYAWIINPLMYFIDEYKRKN